MSCAPDGPRRAQRQLDCLTRQITRLEEADHDVSLADWAWLLQQVPAAEEDSHAPSLPPTDRTNALPGSAAKVDVMQGRAERGECLCSPLDLDPLDLDHVGRLLSKGSSPVVPLGCLAVQTSAGVRVCQS